MNDTERWDGMASLPGYPAGQALDRAQVDGLRFSVKQVQQPLGQDRSAYLASPPGPDTKIMMALSGVKQHRRRNAFAMTAIVLFFVASIGTSIHLFKPFF